MEDIVHTESNQDIPRPSEQSVEHIIRTSVLPERHETRLQGDILVPPTQDPPVAAEQVADDQSNEQVLEPLPSVAAIHTLKDDMRHVVYDQKMSMIHAAALEQTKRAQNAIEQTKDRPQRVSFLVPMLIVISLAIISIGALVGVAYVENSQSAAQQTKGGVSIVFAEKTAAINISNTQPGTVKVALASALNDTSDTPGSITQVVPQVTSDSTVRSATLTEFFTALGISPPDQLVRSLSPDFFFGFHMLSKREPVFVIPVISYDNAVSGMLAWESNMDDDLTPIVPLVSATKTSTSGTPTPRSFSDTVMHNFDVRVLTNDAGAPVLYYSFPSPSLLVIATNPYTFPEIINRLQAQREL